MRQPVDGRHIDLSAQFDRYYPKIYTYFRYRGMDTDAANDLAASVFERALTRLNTYDHRKAAFQTWLFAIARNTAANYWKAKTRSQLIPLQEAAYLPGPDPLPEDVLAKKEELVVLIAALGNLEERDREVIALKFAGALTNRQIAGLLDLSANHVGVVLYRALNKLKEMISESERQVKDE